MGELNNDIGLGIRYYYDAEIAYSFNKIDLQQNRNKTWITADDGVHSVSTTH